MYRKILVALDNTKADRALLPHVSKLAKLTGARLVLIHVADGWSARLYHSLHLKESEEMNADLAYLQKSAALLSAQKLKVEIRLALGTPAKEILRLAKKEKCDLIAMTSHGHRIFADIILGSTIDYVRHRTRIPVLAVSQ